MHKFIVKNLKEQIVGGIVYAPGSPTETDSDGDFSDEEQITAGQRKFMDAYFKDTNRININHKKGTLQAFPILESFIAPEGCTKGGQSIKKGSWYMSIRITDPDVWAAITRSELQGFSMEGRASAG